MGPETILGGVLVATLTAYLLFGGADFGAGVWDLLARGPRRREQRAWIEHAIGPIWEANHVWLIFAAVILFSAFPSAFAAVSTALHVPLTIFLIGVVFRGSAFVFRSYDPDNRHRWGTLFSVASVISPVLLGAAIGTMASGAVRVEQGAVTSGFFAPWLMPFPFVAGLMTLVLCAFLAATYLAREAPDGPLREDFRRNALISSGVLLALAATTLWMSSHSAPRIYDGLVAGPGRGAVFVGAVAAGTAFVALLRRHYGLARLAAGAQATALVVGWAVSQYPYLLVPDITLQSAAANPKTLRALVWAIAGGMPILLPSLYVLFKVFKAPDQMPPASGSPPEIGDRLN